MISGPLIIGNTPRPGWVMDIDVPSGERRHWEFNFPAGADPMVERDENGLHVRSKALDAAIDADDASAIGRDTLSRMNGLQQIAGRKHPVAYVGVARIDDEGHRHQEIRITGVMAALEAGDLGGGDRTVPTPLQRQFDGVEASTDLKLAVGYFAEQESWFAVYKCIEAMKLAAGGDKALVEKTGVAKGDIELAQWTANTPRHHPNPKKGTPPSVPMPFHEARALLRKMLEVLLRDF